MAIIIQPNPPITGGGGSTPTGLELGELSSNAYYGDKGKTAYDHSQTTHAPSNAEQNVNADWNAVSGDAQILNKPTIPTMPVGIPPLGVITQFLQWASSGVAKWVTASGDAIIRDGGSIEVNKTRLNIRNETGTAIATTKAVYMTGFNNLPLVGLADNTNEVKHNVIGVTVGSISNSADGYIATSGQFDAETNGYSAVGVELYLGTNGALVEAQPTTGDVQHVGIVTVKANYPTGKILLYRLPETHIVSSPSGVNTIIRLGDSIGVNKISIRDYGNVEVASINSDGLIVGTNTNWDSAYSNSHSHTNKSILDSIQEALTTALKTAYDGAVTHIADAVKHITATERTNWGSAYTHSGSAHAPSNAQKNSDIIKSEIEAKLTGEIASHSHVGVTPAVYDSDLLSYNRDVTVRNSNNMPTTILYKRPSDSTNFMQRVYSNLSGTNYLTCTETFYASNGSTVVNTVIYTFTYGTLGEIDTYTRVIT